MATKTLMVPEGADWTCGRNDCAQRPLRLPDKNIWDAVLENDLNWYSAKHK